MARILVVEDNLAGRNLVKALLKTRGHDTIETANGVMALTATRHERPDLIVLDVLMPSMDGFEFLRQLRADPEIAGTRVLLHTSTHESPETLSKAREYGVTAILSKGATPETILAAIDKELARDD